MSYSYNINPGMDQYISPFGRTKIETPLYKGSLPPGVHGQINFYDRVTGKLGPSVSTLNTSTSLVTQYRPVDPSNNISNIFSIKS